MVAGRLMSVDRGSATEVTASSSVPEAGDSAASWSGLNSNDYGRAVIRLATVALGGQSHLIWASVELLPTEVPAPGFAE